MFKNVLIMKLASACLMIITGAIIYIISRQNILFFNWIPISVIEALRNCSINDSSWGGYFIVYCLPDGLWYGALLLLQSTLLGKSIMSRIIYWISLALPFIWEVLQIHKDIPGTFDPMDLCVYFFTLILFIISSKQSS